MRRRGLLLAVLVLVAAPTAAKTSITVNTGQIFGTIDPAKIKDNTDYMAAVNLYEGLTTTAPDGTVLPLLAESWELAADRVTYTFHLRPGARFQNGDPVEAEDVVWSIRRLLALDQGPAFIFSDLVTPETVAALDPATVRIRLERPFSPFLSTTPLMFVIDSKAVRKQGDAGDTWAETLLGRTPLGSGPYRLHAWERGGTMVLERNEAYLGGFPEHPIDEVRLITTGEEATVKALAKRGDLSLSSEFQSDDTYEFLSRLPDYRLLSSPTPYGYYIKLNHAVAPTDDPAVRRAIAYAVDYATVRKMIQPGTPLRGPLPDSFAAAHDDSIAAPVFDLDRARKELAASRYAGQGKIPLLHVYAGDSELEAEIGLLLKSTLDKIGFDVTLRAEPWNRIVELASHPQTTPATSQIIVATTYASPDSLLFGQYHSKAAGTYSAMSWLNDPDTDHLIDASRYETDPDKLRDLYYRLQRRLVDDQTDVFLLSPVERHGIHRCLTGYVTNPTQSFGYNFSHFSWVCP